MDELFDAAFRTLSCKDKWDRAKFRASNPDYVPPYMRTTEDRAETNREPVPSDPLVKVAETVQTVLKINTVKRNRCCK